MYPWSRLLTSGAPQQPLRVLESCHIRWGQVVAVAMEHVVVRSRPLTWDGSRIELGPVREERVRNKVDGRGFVPDPVPDEWLALHWDWVSDRLSTEDVDWLERETVRQLRLTNDRLGAG